MSEKAMSNINREYIKKAYEQGIEAIILLIESIVKEHGNQLQELSKVTITSNLVNNFMRLLRIKVK